jgi:tRNA-dihydrouridine synthase
LGRRYDLPGVLPSDPETIEDAVAAVRAATSLPVTIGG